MAEIKIDDTIDITDVVCPTTFVKAKVALEELEEGQILSIRLNDGEPVQNVPRSIKEDIRLNDGEPVQNVPRSIKEEGHEILKLDDNQDGTYTLIVKKVGD